MKEEEEEGKIPLKKILQESITFKQYIFISSNKDDIEVLIEAEGFHACQWPSSYAFIGCLSSDLKENYENRVKFYRSPLLKFTIWSLISRVLKCIRMISFS